MLCFACPSEIRTHNCILQYSIYRLLILNAQDIREFLTGALWAVITEYVAGHVIYMIMKAVWP